MAQLPSQPWEADREHNAPDRLDKCWGSISHDINSTISSLFKEVERVKDSAGLPDFNIEFSAASAQQNDNEMLLSLKVAKDKFSEMEDKFRKILQNKPFIITEEDVTGWLNDATTAHQSVDQYLSISGHKTTKTTDQLLSYPIPKEEKSGESNEWWYLKEDTDIQVSEEDNSVHQGVRL